MWAVVSEVACCGAVTRASSQLPFNSLVSSPRSSCAQTKTVHQHGFGGLYRGLTSLLIGTAPKASLRFTAFSQISKLLQARSHFLTPFASVSRGRAVISCRGPVYTR